MPPPAGSAPDLRRVAVVALVAALALIGCSRSTQPPGASSPPPIADSPEHALERIRFAWEHRDTVSNGTLPAANFWYGFLVSDSATNPWGNTPWNRAQELIFARHLFAGGAPSGAPAATGIAFSFQSQPIPTADSRPGRNPLWHQEASTIVAVKIDRSDGSSVLIGAPVRFFLVRGDSADLTPEMIAAGMAKSSGLWYLEGWNDLNTTPSSNAKLNRFAELRDPYR